MRTVATGNLCPVESPVATATAALFASETVCTVLAENCNDPTETTEAVVEVFKKKRETAQLKIIAKKDCLEAQIVFLDIPEGVKDKDGNALTAEDFSKHDINGECMFLADVMLPDEEVVITIGIDPPGVLYEGIFQFMAEVPVLSIAGLTVLLAGLLASGGALVAKRRH